MRWGRHTITAAVAATVATTAVVAAAVLSAPGSPGGAPVTGHAEPQAVQLRVLVDGEAAEHPVSELSRATVAIELDEQFPDADVTLVTNPGGEVAFARVETEAVIDVRIGGNRAIEQVATTSDDPTEVVAQAGYQLREADQVRVVSTRHVVDPMRRRAGIETTPTTVSTPAAQVTQLDEADRVVVVKVRTSTEKVTHRLRRPVKRVPTDQMYQGQRQQTAPGKDGLRVVKVSTTRHNGRVVAQRRKVLRSVAPRPRRVLVGTAALPDPTPTEDHGTGPWPRVGGGAEHKNWAALAHCESSGNPRAVNPAGYYGLYQFNTGTWGTVGGTGLPSEASAAEQTYRAKLLYASRGAQPWPHCGRYL